MEKTGCRGRKPSIRNEEIYKTEPSPHRIGKNVLDLLLLEDIELFIPNERS